MQLSFKCCAMGKCTAYNCENHDSGQKKTTKIPPLSWHGYPKDEPARLAQWLHQVHRDNFTPGPFSKLCSEHFTEDCFVVDMFEKITGKSRNSRKKSAIETRRSTDYFHPQGSDDQD